MHREMQRPIQRNVHKYQWIWNVKKMFNATSLTCGATPVVWDFHFPKKNSSNGTWVAEKLTSARDWIWDQTKVKISDISDRATTLDSTSFKWNVNLLQEKKALHVGL